MAQGEYLMDIADNQKERELAKNIVDKATQMSKLISKLLLISRIDANRQKLNLQKVDISVITDIAIENVCDMSNDKNVEISVDIEEETFVYGDEILLVSVIENLISNGIKYGRNMVKIGAENDGKYVKITVSDDGVGIPQEHINKVWGRFYRVDNVRNDEYGSNGLGLSVVKAIVELHGGTVEVRSEVDKGTEFTIRFEM